jgi:hypothetical protein
MGRTSTTIPVMTESELVSELARTAVAGAAPSELPIFAAVADAYFSGGRYQPRIDATGESPLGFGTGIEMGALAPVALAVATRVFWTVATLLGEAIKKQAQAEVSDRIKGVLSRTNRQDNPPLTPAQLSAVRDVAHEAAVSLGVCREEATLLSDAIIGALSVPRRS